MHRSRTHRILGGVLGGIAESRGWSPWLFRVAFVLIFGFSLQIDDATYRLTPASAGLIVYVALWALMPKAPEEARGSM